MYGISHTRAPTETRPGVIAVFGGFYEDVSAVTKNFRGNPVEYDTLFNESRHTWAFGSSSGIRLFSLREKHRKEEIKKTRTRDNFYYEVFGDTEDFAVGGTLQDIWTLKKASAFLNSSHANPDLHSRLMEDKIVLYMQLNGVDTSGHYWHSENAGFLKKVEVLDAVVRNLTAAVEDFYGNDGSTAFLLTSDHGQTPEGRHGGGEPTCTRTPVLAWGSGIRKSNRMKRWLHPHPLLDSPELLQFGGVRYDVEHADLTPLMSVLIGVPIPMNSEGVLPRQFLDGPSKKALVASLANAKQLYAQVQVKSGQKSQRTFWFKPFPHAGTIERILAEVASLLRVVPTNSDLSDAQVEEVSRLGDTAITLSADGLHYFQTYDHAFLRLVISSAYVFFILFSLMIVRIPVFHRTEILAREPVSGNQKQPLQGLRLRCRALVSHCFRGIGSPMGLCRCI